MSLYRACCCNDQCIDDCCVWWSCSGGANRQITLSGTWQNMATCDDGVSREANSGTWTISATITRTGTDCSTYRYYANNVQLTFSFRWWLYVDSLGTICNVPPGPNQCDHCDNCQCGSVKFQKCKRIQYSFNGNVNGKPGLDPNIPVDLQGLRVPGSAITIACMPDPCNPPCVRPVLIFTPGSMCEDASNNTTCAPGGCVDALYEEILDGPPPCCIDTVTSYLQGFCIPKFAILGKSECLANTTFDGADYYWHDFGCAPFFPIQTSPCNGYTPTCTTGASCMTLNFTAKVCDDCRDYRDPTYACYELDANNVPQFLCYPSPSIVCCSNRVSNNVSWNIV